MKNIVVVFLIFLGSYFTHAQDKDLKKFYLLLHGESTLSL